MPSLAVPRAPLPRWLSVLLHVNLACQVLIVVTGGLVRLTGSGLGCPTWPQCVPGSYTPVLSQPQGLHKYIEFGNRTLTGLVGLVALAVLAALLWHIRSGPPSRRDYLWAAFPLLGVILQAVVGGITVLTTLHPGTVAAHFLISMALISGSAALPLRFGPATQPVPVRQELHWVSGVFLALTVLVLVLGTLVTGSGPHSGDADEPARLSWDPRFLAWLHADSVLLWFGALVVLLVALRLVAAPARSRGAARLTLITGLVQGAIGYGQYATGLPVLAVAGHMLGASILVIAVTRYWVILRQETHPVKNLTDFNSA